MRVISTSATLCEDRGQRYDKRKLQIFEILKPIQTKRTRDLKSDTLMNFRNGSRFLDPFGILARKKVGFKPSSRAGPGPGLVKPSRARHKAWAGSGLGLEKCQARQASQARAWIYMAKSVPKARSAHGILAQEASVPSNAEPNDVNCIQASTDLALNVGSDSNSVVCNRGSIFIILFFIFGYEKAWAQAQAQGFRPRTQGSGSGLENLKPEPAQAEPKPGHSGRAGPATSLNWAVASVLACPGPLFDPHKLLHAHPQHILGLHAFWIVLDETRGSNISHPPYIANFKPPWIFYVPNGIATELSTSNRSLECQISREKRLWKKS
ncbi:hypothetical protein B0H16DRAFT_1465007 [Mycena metata]|uniref:Uncharacterized protein n=1 Tax=Mycena metata TaxID=1033252 RepID=A0AAD7ICN4_9AGAR|nr:hypothetical protein B0H16DRAFT_1465007 [Mycena metata]